MKLKMIEREGIQFEVFGLRQRIRHVITNPFKNWILPTGLLRKVMVWSGSPLVLESLHRPGGWKAMEIIYKNAPPINSIDALSVRDACFPMAIRNRKKLVTKTIAELVRKHAQASCVVIVGVGAGPGTNIQEGILQSGIDKFKVAAYLIDMDSDAFEYGKEAAKKRGLDEQVHFIQGDARGITKHVPNIAPHIVKMIGILEYLNDDQVLDLFEAMHKTMAPGGSIITHSIEDVYNTRPFLKRVLNWHVYTRTPQHATQLLERAGFSGVVAKAEPMGIYTILVAQKA
jgi:SAM-dependent methyltransferase